MPGFGTAGAWAGLLGVALVLGLLVWSAVVGRPAAVRPQMFGGSLVLEDLRPPPVIDLATGQVTIRLDGLEAQVGAASYDDVQAVPVSGGTVLVNRRTGAFNFLEQDSYVTDPDGPGVGLGKLDSLTAAEGLASGPDAYILRVAPRSTVSLIGRQTVAEAAKAQVSQPAGGVTAAPAAAVSPIGFAALDASVSTQPGSAVVSGRRLWVLATESGGCRILSMLPSAGGHDGLQVTRGYSGRAPCARDALAAAGDLTGLAEPGSIRLFAPDRRPHRRSALPAVVGTPFTVDAGLIVPVSGSPSQLWFLARGASGWILFGADPHGRVLGPFALPRLGASALPAAPVFCAGLLYTLDRAAAAPDLWTIEATNGHMAPVRGVASYPEAATESQSFVGAEVVGAGPRVVFNNPGSLHAVVVFTDATHAPVIVDKSRALAVSATGPADLNAAAPTTTTAPGTPSPTPGPATPTTTLAPPRPVPVVQPVSPQVTCANTAQKPYVPQVTAVTPSSGTALVQWSYQLLDETDCEPSSWAVQVRAQPGGRQPAQPIQVVQGQNQFLFAGLRPSTNYQVTVTAYINAQSTVSAPVTFTTSARGPDAPLSVTTKADGKGHWVIAWKPCTEAVDPACVVSADQWSVIGAACGGSYVGTPPTVQVSGSETTATVDAAALGLLGRSLTFSVQGSLGSGLTGNPTGDGACTEAWRPADPAAIKLTAAGAQQGSTITASLQVSVSGDPTAALGSLPESTVYVYSVGGKAVGPTSQPTVAVPGLVAGAPLTPSVQVYPGGHPDAAVTVTGDPFSTNLAWPADITQLTVTPAVDPGNPNNGTVTVVFPGDLPKGPLQAHGAQVVCGSYSVSEADQPINDGHVTYPADLVSGGTGCTVSLVVIDTADPNPYGVSSPPAVSAPFSFPDHPYAFTDEWVGDCTKDRRCGPAGEPWQLAITAASGGPPRAGARWSVAVEANAQPVDLGHSCSAEATSPTDLPLTVTLPTSLLPGCDPPYVVDVTVTYVYLGRTVTVHATGPTNTPGQPADLAPSTTTTTVVPRTTTTAPAATTTRPPCPTTTASPGPSPSTTAAGSTTTATPAATQPGTTAPATTSTTAPCGRPAASLASARANTDLAADTMFGSLLSVLVGTALIGPRRGRRHRSDKRGCV